MFTFSTKRPSIFINNARLKPINQHSRTYLTFTIVLFIYAAQISITVANDGVENICFAVLSSLNHYTHEWVPLSSVFDGKRMFNQNQNFNFDFDCSFSSRVKKLEQVAADFSIDLLSTEISSIQRKFSCSAVN